MHVASCEVALYCCKQLDFFSLVRSGEYKTINNFFSLHGFFHSQAQVHGASEFSIFQQLRRYMPKAIVSARSFKLSLSLSFSRTIWSSYLFFVHFCSSTKNCLVLFFYFSISIEKKLNLIRERWNNSGNGADIFHKIQNCGKPPIDHKVLAEKVAVTEEIENKRPSKEWISFQFSSCFCLCLFLFHFGLCLSLFTSSV